MHTDNDNESRFQHKKSKQASSDRRYTRRHLLIVKKMTLAEIIFGDNGVPRIHYVFINDISETGIRLSSDIFFPYDKKIKLKLFLPHSIQLETHLVWKREIGIKDYMNGLEFIESSKINEKGKQELLNWAEPYFDKTSFPINSTLFLETDLDEPLDKIYVFLLKISPQRLKFMSNNPFPEGNKFNIAFSLQKNIPSISTKAQVLFQKKHNVSEEAYTQPNNFTTWMELFDSDIVKNHLRETLAEDPPPNFYDNDSI